MSYRHVNMTPIYSASMNKRLKSGADIRRARERLGLTLEDAAHYLDVAVVTLSRWERDVIQPSLIVLRGIEALFAEYKSNERTR
jgi:transcriptional regulator with XRE-family HTH domain